MLRVASLLAMLTCVQAGLLGWEWGGTDRPAPQQLERFLREFDLVGHANTMASLGYDNVADFLEMTEAEVQVMNAALSRAGLPPGHIGRIQRAITTLRSRSDRHGAPAPSASRGEVQVDL